MCNLYVNTYGNTSVCICIASLYKPIQPLKSKIYEFSQSLTIILASIIHFLHLIVRLKLGVQLLVRTAHLNVPQVDLTNEVVSKTSVAI